MDGLHQVVAHSDYSLDIECHKVRIESSPDGSDGCRTASDRIDFARCDAWTLGSRGSDAPAEIISHKETAEGSWHPWPFSGVCCSLLRLAREALQRWPDVLVHLEEILRVIPVLQLRQTLELRRPIRGPHPVFTIIRTEKVDIGATRREGANSRP